MEESLHVLFKMRTNKTQAKLALSDVKWDEKPLNLRYIGLYKLV